MVAAFLRKEKMTCNPKTEVCLATSNCCGRHQLGVQTCCRWPEGDDPGDPRLRADSGEGVRPGTVPVLANAVRRRQFPVQDDRRGDALERGERLQDPAFPLRHGVLRRRLLDWLAPASLSAHCESRVHGRLRGCLHSTAYVPCRSRRCAEPLFSRPSLRQIPWLS